MSAFDDVDVLKLLEVAARLGGESRAFDDELVAETVNAVGDSHARAGTLDRLSVSDLADEVRERMRDRNAAEDNAEAEAFDSGLQPVD